MLTIPLKKYLKKIIPNGKCFRRERVFISHSLNRENPEIKLQKKNEKKRNFVRNVFPYYELLLFFLICLSFRLLIIGRAALRGTQKKFLREKLIQKKKSLNWNFFVRHPKKKLIFLKIFLFILRAHLIN